MFLVNIEVSIVATSLVSIVNDLQGFDQIGWVVTSYLVTYTSTFVIARQLFETLNGVRFDHHLVKIQ
jgi:MFS family permease